MKGIFITIAIILLQLVPGWECKKPSDCEYPLACNSMLQFEDCPKGKEWSYRYDSDSSHCYKNDWNKCGTTCNNFDTEEECRQTCIASILGF
ncbi:PI-actitoxin-Aeq3c-like [Ornithodoros turicata]|uniref:PI-actitoxin-Aeq3c-like n=1 Tax=Ornithodoros turicata TaxID=34597 RepID=UPI003139E266